MGRRRARHHRAARGYPAKTAIVADVAFAVRPDRGAIGAAGNFRDHLLEAIRPYPSQLLRPDLDQDHRAVRHHHRPFAKRKFGGEDADTGHESLPALVQADSVSARAAISLRDVMAKSTSIAKEASQPSFRGALLREPGIHNHHREYGFRACASSRLSPTRGASRNDEG